MPTNPTKAELEALEARAKVNATLGTDEEILMTSALALYSLFETTGTPQAISKDQALTLIEYTLKASRAEAILGFLQRLFPSPNDATFHNLEYLQAIICETIGVVHNSHQKQRQALLALLRTLTATTWSKINDGSPNLSPRHNPLSSQHPHSGSDPGTRQPSAGSAEPPNGDPWL